MDWGPLVTTAITVFGSIVASFLTWLATRPKTRAEVGAAEAQTQLTSLSGFQLLIRELQQERVHLAEVIEKQAGQIERQSGEIQALRAEVAAVREDLDDVLARWRRGEPAPPPVERRNRR
ncbi:hypothetical protein Q8W71_17745 [Methylobacterium sp. NEAU 140]|uniref:hypothetical protein n=1 Tax=Methylobacterium sp. NEAU 140 TaxID=3064945 RepID=UPI002735AC90|nr:hypothetical protein [Methylobacterium sp. NEAU 140]MDP4024472.1 hypothetical protein [Methylobacterium sp. NEAU 140]